MPTLRDMLLVEVMPAIVALVIGVLIAGRYRREPPGRHRLAWAVAMGVAYVIGHAIILGTDTFRLSQARDWLICAAPVIMFAAILESRAWWRWYGRWPLRIALCMAMPIVLLLTPLRTSWSQTESIVRVSGFAAAMLIAWSTIAAQPTQPNSDRIRAIIVLLVCASAALLLGLSGSTIYPMLAGNITASLATLLLLAWWRDGFDGLAAAGPFVALLIGGLLIAGWWYASVDAHAALLLANALLPAWTRFAPHEMVRPWQAGWILRIAVSLALIAAALTPAMVKMIEAMHDPSPYAY